MFLSNILGRKRAVLALAIALLPGLVGTGSAGDLGNWVNNGLSKLNASAAVQNPSHFASQKRDYFTGGSVSLDYGPDENLQPFNIQMPAISMGCNGISVNWGGFSMLKFDKIVKFFKSVLQAAPAMAFQLALSTLCKDCAAIMSKLETAAKIANGINMNKCAAANAVGKSMLYMGSSVIGGISGSGSPGTGDSFLDKFDENINLSENWGSFKSYLNTKATSIDSAWSTFNNSVLQCSPATLMSGKTCADVADEELFQKGGSLLAKAVADSDAEVMFATTGSTERDKFLSVLRGLLGDVVVVSNVGDSSTPAANSKTPEPRLIPPGNVTAEQFLTATVLGSSNLKIQGTSVNEAGEVTPGEDFFISDSAALAPKYKAAIDCAVDAMRSRRDLDPEILDIIGATSLPLYKIINLYSIGGGNTDTLATLVAFETMGNLLKSNLKKIRNVVAKYTSVKGDKMHLQDKVDDWVKILNEKSAEAIEMCNMAIRSSRTTYYEELKGLQAQKELQTAAVSAIASSSLVTHYLAAKSMR